MMLFQRLIFAGCHADRVVIGSLFISPRPLSTAPDVARTTPITSASPVVARQASQLS